MMFVFVACFSKRGRCDVQKYRLSQLTNPAIPDVFLHKFRLARTQSLKVSSYKAILRVRLWEEAQF